MMTTLSMLIDLRTSTNIPLATNISDQHSSINTAYLLQLNIYVRCLVVIILFQARNPNSGIFSTVAYNFWEKLPTDFRLRPTKRDHLNNQHKNCFSNTISFIMSFIACSKLILSNMCYYIVSINLFLIVISNCSMLNPGPDIKVSYCNAQGLILGTSMRGNSPIFQTNKILHLQSYLHFNSPDILILNETWLNEHVHTNEIVEEQYYKSFRLDRTQEDKNRYGKIGGGGIIIFIKQGLNIETKVLNLEHKVPFLAIEVKLQNSTKFCLSTFYRYSYSGISELEEVEKCLRYISQKYSRKILVGDLNLSSVRDWDNPVSNCPIENRYIELFQNFGFISMINEQTHRAGNILDLILTNNPSSIKDINIEQNLICPSDHFSINFKIESNIRWKPRKKEKIFNYKQANWDAMNQEISSINWSNLFYNIPISSAWNIFKSKIDIAMRKHIPMIFVKFKKRPPWFDSEINEMFKLKETLRKTYKRSQSDADYDAFRRQRKILKQKIEGKKQTYFSVDPCNDDSIIQKKFWNYVKSSSKCSRIPESVHYKSRYRTDTKDRCELFNKFFSDQFTEKSNYNIHVDIDNSNTNFYFTPTTVFKLLKQVKPSRAPGPDGITGHVLKNCAPSLEVPLSILYNKSYSTGELPQDWKLANVVPIHKKSRKDNVENYRPISLTSLVMKIFEKCIRTKIFEICEERISPHQHGFLPKRSCTTQLINFTQDLALNLNSKWQTDVIYFDFAKAFDSVNHDVLLEKLKHIFHIDGHLLQFLISYLKNRKQRVIIDGHFSSDTEVNSGVPQGSIIGPLLFVLFINDITNVLSRGTQILMYADDTKIWKVIHNHEDQITLHKDIANLYDWSVLNKISFHPHKCKVVTVSTNHNIMEYSYTMNGVNLQSCDSECDLGIEILKTFKWNRHHKKVISKASQKLGLLKRNITFSKGKTHRRNLYLSIIRSQFEHGSPIWSPVCLTHHDKFESLQKKCIKWILDQCYAHYSKHEYFEKLKCLDILPLKQKFLMNDILLFYKVTHYVVNAISLPSYIVQYDYSDHNPNINFIRQTRQYNDSDRLKFKCTITPRINAFKDSFFVRTVKHWNNLPIEIRNIDQFEAFKTKLKEHLWLIAEHELDVT